MRALPVLLALASISSPVPAQVTPILTAAGDGTTQLFAPFFVAVADSGNVYVSGFGNDTVFRVTPAGDVSVILDHAGAGPGSSMDGPYRIAIDDEETVYVTALWSNNAFSVRPDGSVTEILDEERANAAGSWLLEPTGIAVDDAGNVFVAGSMSGNLFKIAPDGAVQEVILSALPPGVSFIWPQDVAIDALGNVYVSAALSNNVLALRPSGRIVEVIDGSAGGTGFTLSQPRGIELDAVGNLYVAGFASSNAFRVAPGGAVTRLIGPGGDGLGNELERPWDLAFDPQSGSVYVPGWFSDNLFEVGADGTVTELLDDQSAGGRLDEPRGVAVHPTGRLYVAASASHSVLELVLDWAPGTSFCAGDGTATPCPCGNAGGAGQGCANSAAPGGALVTTGSSSVTYDDLTFTGTGLVPGQPALLFVGDAAVNGGAGVLFGDGLRCAGGGVVRLEVSTPEAAGSADFGAGHGAQGGWTAGDTRYFQVWYRDPAGPCGQSFNTTHALAVELKV